ncbi:MAG: asparagine synthase (glutamine-hydrolyzing) [bacterium]|nr:asparagine synthase (glutamine-hydrolyzing) [bacterium]
MCGIAGYLASTRSDLPAEKLLENMIRVLAHRGPDEHGFHAEKSAGLAHTRLSILDLAGGQQPMANDDETVWISFNGEIFNYIELREDLKQRGYRFRTSSDTEVILRLYEENGADCIKQLNGDFAIAIWDGRRKRLMLARDRMGVRPIYFTRNEGGLYFASEVKALLQVPGISAELDPVALDQIFTFWFPLAPRTAFKNIQEIPPAHILLAQNGHVELRPYWSLDYPDIGSREDQCDENEIAEELRYLLEDATRIRLRSDVPVGAYLSGGLDSSILAAVVNEIAPDRLRTFSVTFESNEFDESEFQNEMVRALGTDHEATLCTGNDIGAIFREVIHSTERPVLRSAPAPLFALSRHAREHGFKVVLSGEGADEVFAGYDIFKEAKLRRFCARQPGSKFRPLLFKRLYPYLPNLQKQSQKYLEAFFKIGMGDKNDPLYSHLPRFRTTSSAKLFFSADLKDELKGYDALEELRNSLPDNFTRWHPLSQAQYLETAHLLPGYILSSQGDRVSMAHSIEGRYPFLDHRVVEFAAKIPPELKMRGLHEKYILRKAMSKLLPKEISNRPKQPYRAPDALSFLGDNAPDYVAELLSEKELAKTGYFNAKAVGKLHAKCEARQQGTGFHDNQAFLGILSTQLLDKEFCSNPGS